MSSNSKRQQLVAPPASSSLVSSSLVSSYVVPARSSYLVPPFINHLSTLFGSLNTAADFLKHIFNPSGSREIRQLITVHGEHIPTLQMPDIPGLKFCMTYLAACGTVNWADNAVNVKILKQYEDLLKESGLMQLKTFPGATPDIYHFVLAIRLAYRLENVDTVHDRQVAGGESLSAGFFSRFKNFSVTLPSFDETTLKRVIAILSTPMTDKDPTKKNSELITLLTGFSLPTAGYYLKRYSLGSRPDNNEHVSWFVKPTKDNSPNSLDKGYEHKVCFFVHLEQPTQPLSTIEEFESAFTANITNIFSSTPQLGSGLSIANIPRSTDTRTADQISKKLPILTNMETVKNWGSVPYTMMDSVNLHLRDEIKFGSPTWNKLVITVKIGGLPFSTVVQWKINLRDGPAGKEAELVFNAWNLVASRPNMGGRLSEPGQENYLATTVELNLFANMLGATYTTGGDVTCSVIGGKIVSGWPVLNVATWTAYTSKQQSNLLFLHPPIIPGVVDCPLVQTPKEFHPPCDLRKNTYNLLTSAAIMFDAIVDNKNKDVWKHRFKSVLEIFSHAAKRSRKPNDEYSKNIRDEFYAVLQLFDALSNSNGESIESKQLMIHPKITTALQQVLANPGIASGLAALGINTVEQLLQGIYRYLRHVTNHLYGAYKRYTEGNLAPGGNVALALDDTMLTQFVMIINALKLSFFSFQFKSLVYIKTRSDTEEFEALKAEILEEATENAAQAKSAEKRARTDAVADEDDLNQDDKISDYSEQLYALPYLSSGEIETFLNKVRELFELSTDDKQADLVDAQLLDVIGRIIIPGLPSLTDDQVLSSSGGTRRRRYSKRRRTNRNKSPRRRSRYNYNNKNKKNNKNNKKKTNRIRRYV